MSFDISEYREMFAEEAAELFDTADEILLEAESSGDLPDDQMASLFRAMHTLKGSGSSVELVYFTKFAHETENFMDQLRNKKIEYRPDMAGLLIDCTDTLRALLDLEMDDNLDDATFSEMSDNLIGQIKAYLSGTGPVSTPVSAPTPEPIEQEERATIEPQTQESTSEASGEGDTYGFFGESDESEAPYGFFGHIEHDASAPIPTPKPKQAEKKESPKEERVAPHPKSAAEEEVSRGNPEDIQITKLRPLDTSAPTPAKAAPKVDDKKGNAASTSTIRVNLDKIDALMNNVGELVITNAMLAQFATNISDSKIGDAISERLELLNRHIRELQESIMSIRMVPMENIYSKFPKVVRDVAKKFDKKIDFKHYGDNVEIDKAMIEGLTDPLMHIIRNSLDHGIEMPDVRKAAGKPETGTVTIGAEQSNGQMIITIIDDGKGIDLERVVAKSIEKGIISENVAAQMTDGEKALLIFEAGLSTADKITDISGRGVGMDVVKTNITKLGGVLKIDTEKGRGATITIILPLTLAILDGLDVAVGDKRYILPLNTIVESLQPQASMIKRIGNGAEELLMLREEFIPVVRLYHLFGVEPRFKELDKGMLIVVKVGNSKVALFVDEFLNQHQVVVKPLDKNFRNVDGVGAATVRGDGTIGLILDVMGIIDEQKKHERKRIA